MPLLGDAHCPRCQAAVPLAALWQRAAKDRGGMFLIGRVGIGCPSCEVKLRVLQFRLVFAAVGSFAFFCAAFGVLGVIEHAKLGTARQDLNLLLIAPAIVGWMFLFKRYGYRFARLRTVTDGEKVAFPLSKPLRLETKGAERPQHQRSESAPSQVAAETASGAEGARPPWICPECGEENPGKFSICCICETQRDAGQQR
jgi:hypothetical protein